jgi:hypothetical protein
VGSRDLLRKQAEKLNFVLERTVNLDPDSVKEEEVVDQAKATQNIIHAFFNHPDCKIILDTILYSLHSTQTAIAVAGAAAVTAGLSIPSVASIALPISLVSSYVSSSSRLRSPLPFTSQTSEPPNSIIDGVSLSVFGVFHHLSQLELPRSASNASKSLKPRKGASADDRWSAGAKFNTPEYKSDPVRPIFHPRNLYIFHMALLAKVVHSQYPIYSLFKRNCYWFALLIYLAAKIIDDILGTGKDSVSEDQVDDSQDDEMTDFFFVPFYLYAAGIAGRWMGFKVCEVKDVVLGRIVRLFFQLLHQHEDAVLCSFCFHYNLLIF